MKIFDSKESLKEDDIKDYDYKAITNKKISEMDPKFQQVFGSRTGK